MVERTKQFSVRGVFFLPSPPFTFYILRSSTPFLSLSLSLNSVIVPDGNDIKPARKLFLARSTETLASPPEEMTARMVLSIRLFNNSQLLYIYSFASGRVQPSSRNLFTHSFVSFSRLCAASFPLPPSYRFRFDFSTRLVSRARSLSDLDASNLHSRSRVEFKRSLQW